MLQNLRVRNWRLATKLGVSIVAVTIVIIGVTALIEGITTRTQLQTEISNSLSSIARSEGERIGADLDKQVSLVHTAVATDDDILDAVTQPCGRDHRSTACTGCSVGRSTRNRE